MKGFKKTIAVMCSALMLAQVAVLPNLSSSQAQAADTGVNFTTMTQHGLNTNSYFWQKAIWNRTTSSYARDVVTRPYPRLVGNQWNVLDSGLEDNGDTNKYQQYAAQYFDFIYLNRVKGRYSDKFVDTYDSTHNPNMGLLKYRNGVYAKAQALGRRVYVLPYHAQEGVENYSPPTSGYEYWFHDNADNPWRTSQNRSTWDLVNDHSGWYRNNDGSYVQYGSYNVSQRRIFDLRKVDMRTYWAGHAYHSAAGSGTTQFDGIFADNWLRSNGPDSTGWRRGANQAAALLRSKWNGDKILVGNGLYSSDYNARDFGMIEDYSGNMRWDFSLSDEFARANQLTIDSSASQSWGTPWNRLARNLMTDDVFAMHDDENGGVVAFVENYISKLGKVGYPVEDRVNLGNNVYKRAFTHGIAYWNNSGTTATVTVPAGLYKNINGVNVEGTVSLGNHAGLILKTRSGIPAPNPTPTNPPVAPSELTVTGVSQGATSGAYYVNLSWRDNSSDETSFRIYQSVNSTANYQVIKTPSANGTTYGINLGSTPTQGTYYFKITSVNSNGESTASNVVTAQVGTVTPPPTPQPPAAPTGLSVSINRATAGNYVANLSWTDASNNESGFKILQSVNSTSSFQQTQTVGANASTTAIDLGSNPASGTYYYQVIATNTDGDSQPSNTANAVIQILNVPAAPSELIVTGVSKGATSGNYYVNLDWKDNSSNETGFEIYQSINSTSNFQRVKTPSANGTSYGINLGSTPTTGTYYYKIVAVNADGKSPDSNVATAEVGQVTPPPTPQPPAAPTGLTAMAGKDFQGNGVIILTWQDNSNDEQGFNLYLSNSATGGFSKVAAFGPGQTIVVHNIGSVPNGTTFYYQVKSFNTGGESTSSNTASGVVI